MRKPSRADLLAAEGRTVPDIIGPGLRVLFCGINPSLYSAAVGHHFARPGNRFWPTLHAAGFTARRLSPQEEQELLAAGYGITNIVDRATATADQLVGEELVAGGARLAEKVARLRPQVLAVLGVTAYRTAFGRPKAVIGPQEHRLGGTLVWVLPNPSGLNAHYQAADLAAVYGELRRHTEGYMTTPTDPRMERARLSLEGLSLGDAFGERFFAYQDVIDQILDRREPPPPPWPFTDDTQMALSIVGSLCRHGAVDQDWLARSFAEHYEPSRGYGAGMHRLLRKLAAGADWREASYQQFSGQGSFGNGAAMRVAPLGGYFADDLDQAAEQAARSAEVTHAHPEGVAGAVAVAVAAAWAWRIGQGGAPTGAGLIDLVLPFVPDSEVRSRLGRARDLSPGAPPQTGAAVLGSGFEISAQDTVPFTIWCASSYLNDYEAALWHTAAGLGDIDTTCAIVGGIVALAVGPDGLPPGWRDQRESLPDWPFIAEEL